MQSSLELVQGMDALSANIPHYAERFAEMASDTEEMAKELEDRMKYLEDGYDYLSKVSSQVPEAIREMSSNYKMGVLDGAEANLFGEEEKKALENEDDKLAHLKKELHSISQERVIVDVFTRSTISRVKSHFTKLGVDNEPVFIGHDRAEKSRIQTRNHALARLSSTDKGAKNEEHISKALLQTEPPEKLRQGARPASSISDYQGDLNGPLEIPSFRANHHNNAHSNNDENTVNRNVRGGEGDKKKARNLTVRPASNIMVPSMKQGSLPPEIKNLQVVPTVDPELVMGKIMARKEKKQRRKP